MKKHRKILIIILIISILFINNMKVVEATDIINKSEAYEKWENLSEEKREETIQPSIVDTPLEKTIKQSRYNAILGTSTLEEKYSLKDNINIRVKNQKQSYSCWAFSFSSIFETTIENKYKKTSQEYSPMHIEYTTVSMYNRTVKSGGNAYFALAYSNSGKGLIYESDFPFESVYDEKTNSYSNYYLKDSNSVNTEKDAKSMVTDATVFPDIYKSYTDSGVYYKCTYGTNGMKMYSNEEVQAIRELIKKHIKENGAVSAMMYTDLTLVNSTGNYSSPENFFNNSKNAYYCNDSSKVANHLITIVGWDDNFAKENFNEKNRPVHDGAYIVLNSWGENVLDDGYFYISYDDAIIEQSIIGVNALEEYKTDHTEVYDNLYQYDELGESIKLYYFDSDNKNTLPEGYAANVFTREDKNKIEYLNNVGLYLFEAQGVEIYVNPLSDDLNISNAQLVASYTGTNALEAGYHRVDLSSPIRIKGEKFAIIVKYINKKEATLSVECNIGDSGISSANVFFNTAKSNPEESYISIDGTNWNDLYNYNYAGAYTLKNTNACIKAFTKLSDTIKTEGVEIDSKTADVNEGSQIALNAIIIPIDATNKNIKWSTSDETIATVENGIVTGKSKGTVTITATTEEGNKVATCIVTVNEVIKVSEIKLNKYVLTMEIGDQGNLVATITPTNAVNQNVIWRSSNESVATISENGIITAKKKGTTTITVTTEDGGKFAECKITVTDKTNTDDDIYKSDSENQTSGKITNSMNSKDTTIATTKIPNTGNKQKIILFFGLIILIGIMYIRYRCFKDVK